MSVVVCRHRHSLCPLPDERNRFDAFGVHQARSLLRIDAGELSGRADFATKKKAAQMAPPVRVKNTRQLKNPKPRSDSTGTKKL
jgi:hypothetical protein